MRQISSWIEVATATDTTAVARRAAPAGGLSHYVTSVSASFEEILLMSVAALVLKQAGAEIGRWFVSEVYALSFSSPVKIAAGKEVTLELTPGNALVSGTATMTGYTL